MGLRKGSNVEAQTVIVGVESFLYEVTEDLWLDLCCLLLTDPARKISLQAFTQPTPVDARFVAKLKDGTPSDYPKQWSGFAVTIGSVMAEELGVAHTTWQKAVTGLSREELLLPAARALLVFTGGSCRQGWTLCSRTPAKYLQCDFIKIS